MNQFECFITIIYKAYFPNIICWRTSLILLQCIWSASNPSSAKFQKFISVGDINLEIDKGFSLWLFAILSEEANRNSVWIDFIDNFLLTDKILLNFQSYSFTLSVIYYRYISNLMKSVHNFKLSKSCWIQNSCSRNSITIQSLKV